jgi:hypothetical protein
MLKVWGDIFQTVFLWGGGLSLFLGRPLHVFLGRPLREFWGWGGCPLSIIWGGEALARFSPIGVAIFHPKGGGRPIYHPFGGETHYPPYWGGSPLTTHLKRGNNPFTTHFRVTTYIRGIFFQKILTKILYKIECCSQRPAKFFSEV